MNDKLKKHVDILFAAAPKNQKTAEIKEELLTNLNDKYNDLLANGYDSTAAFHIALSGIGDIDELLKECGETSSPLPAGEGATFVSSLLAPDMLRMVILLGFALAVLMIATSVHHSNFFPFIIACVLVYFAVAPLFRKKVGNRPPGDCVAPNADTVFAAPPTAPAVTPTIRTKDTTSLLVFLAIIFFLIGPIVLSVNLFDGLTIDHLGIRTTGMRIDHNGIEVQSIPAVGLNSMFICWAIGIGLIVFAIVHSVTSRKDETIPVPWETPSPPTASPPALEHVAKDDIAFKRIVAGILGILLGVLGIHKFYLGFTGAGLIMLLATVLSLGILSPVSAIIGFVEGILYLLKSDRDFYRDYEIRRRNWF